MDSLTQLWPAWSATLVRRARHPAAMRLGHGWHSPQSTLNRSACLCRWHLHLSSQIPHTLLHLQDMVWMVMLPQQPSPHTHCLQLRESNPATSADSKPPPLFFGCFWFLCNHIPAPFRPELLPYCPSQTTWQPGLKPLWCK